MMIQRCGLKDFNTWVVGCTGFAAGYQASLGFLVDRINPYVYAAIIGVLLGWMAGAMLLEASEQIYKTAYNEMRDRLKNTTTHV